MRKQVSRVAGLVAALVLAAVGCAAHHQMEEGAPAPGSPGLALLAKRCGGCHAIPDPNRMSGEKWTAALERMKKRIELPAAEWDSLALMARAPEP